MVCEMLHGDDMTRRAGLSEAERLLAEQSDDLDPLFFDDDLPASAYENSLPVGDRPRTRADCLRAKRPCPWVTCRHHLYLDIRADGVVRVNFPSGPRSMLATCALDLAEDGPRTLDQVSMLMGMSRERVRQIEERALVKLRYAIRRDDMGYAGTDMEAEDGALVREDTLALQEQTEAQRRKNERLAVKEARKEARRVAAIARAERLANIARLSQR
jgi:hypothetical protein